VVRGGKACAVDVALRGSMLKLRIGGDFNFDAGALGGIDTTGNALLCGLPGGCGVVFGNAPTSSDTGLSCVVTGGAGAGAGAGAGTGTGTGAGVWVLDCLGRVRSVPFRFATTGFAIGLSGDVLGCANAGVEKSSGAVSGDEGDTCHCCVGLREGMAGSTTADACGRCAPFGAGSTEPAGGTFVI
jgi:hypothetical protein